MSDMTKRSQETPAEDQVRHLAKLRLDLTVGQYTLGEVWQSDDDARIAAGEKIREYAEVLGAKRVEAIVQEVEQKFASGFGEEDWRCFAAAIIPESYEGRYPGLSCPFDQYREPFLRKKGASKVRW